MKTITLTDRQLSLMLNAIATAEKVYSEQYQQLCNIANSRENAIKKELIDNAEYLHDLSCEMADLFSQLKKQDRSMADELLDSIAIITEDYKQANNL